MNTGFRWASTERQSAWSMLEAIKEWMKQKDYAFPKGDPTIRQIFNSIERQAKNRAAKRRHG